MTIRTLEAKIKQIASASTPVKLTINQINDLMDHLRLNLSTSQIDPFATYNVDEDQYGVWLLNGTSTPPINSKESKATVKDVVAYLWADLQTYSQQYLNEIQLSY